MKLRLSRIQNVMVLNLVIHGGVGGMTLENAAQSLKPTYLYSIEIFQADHGQLKPMSDNWVTFPYSK